MADFAITISNSLNVFGPCPTFWGSGNMLWTTDFWGDGSRSLALAAEKVLSESLTSDSGVSKNVTHTIDLGSLDISSDATNDLDDSSGYDYVYTSPTTDPDSRANTTYASGSTAGNSWTSLSVNSTSWTERNS